MAKYTTNFLTWLKGLFHTKTEVNNLLETKINTVDVQGKITSFTNKDRINIERLINYMDNSSGSDYYTLDLKGVKGSAGSSTTTGEYVINGIFSDDKNRLAIDNTSLNMSLYLGAMIYKNGVAQTSSSATITFKLIDGTIIGTNNRTLGTDDRNGNMKNYICYREVWDGRPSWSPGIYYIYAEATISGSVYKSNILTVFVKDNSNLVDYNQWSASDYSTNLTGIDNRYTNTLIATSENRYSTIGENSIHVNSLNTEFKAIDIGPFNVSANETYSLTADIINKNANTVQLRLNETGVGNSGVNIPISNVWNNFSISRTIEQNGSLLIRLVVQSVGDVYIDNILLKKVQ